MHGEENTCPNRPKFQIVQGRERSEKKGREWNSFGVGIPPSLPHSGFSQPRSFRPSFPFYFRVSSMMTMPPQMLCSKQGMSQKALLIIINTFAQMLRSLFLFVPALLTRRTFKSFVICSSVLFTALFFSLDFPGVDRR